MFEMSASRHIIDLILSSCSCDTLPCDSSIDQMFTPPLPPDLVHVNELCLSETIEKQAR